ncbi:MAG: tetratricopeptide repeat protein [Lachnospiraceae bacterium]|nr:tetratricopeptide repeat protein [Lachnospiraceae bacterium]
METAKKNRQIANAYYNLGLAKAQHRDLCGAVKALKKSLRFDKYQTDARNLLGLIYHEVGEVGAAVAQWIISLNLQEQDNLAEEYLRKVHAGRGYLEVADQSAKKYNQALAYAQNENEDLAILLLMRVAAEMPNYVKAQELLALLFIHQENFTKAGRCLYQALKVDPYNPQALRYMTIVKQNTGKAEVERKKLKNAFSHRQMQDDDIILPPSYKENTGLQSVLNILAGLIMGAVVIFFLVMPASREALNSRHNEELLQKLEVINQKNIEIDSLHSQMESAEKAKEQAETSLASLLSDQGSTTGQYQKLVQILQAYRDGDLRTAALLYVELDLSVLNDGAVNDTVAWIQQDMEANGAQLLEQMGDEAFAQEGGAAQAAEYYQKSLLIQKDNPGALFKLGNAFQAQGNTEQANQYYGEVIMNYPDSEYAEQAKAQRGY